LKFAAFYKRRCGVSKRGRIGGYRSNGDNTVFRASLSRVSGIITPRLTMNKLLAYGKGIQTSGKPIHYFRRVSRLTADILVEGRKEQASGNALDEYTLLA
jgi:hypothetical protein